MRAGSSGVHPSPAPHQQAEKKSGPPLPPSTPHPTGPPPPRQPAPKLTGAAQQQQQQQAKPAAPGQAAQPNQAQGTVSVSIQFFLITVLQH